MSDTNSELDNSQNKDEFDQQLEDNTLILKKCQSSKNYTSCISCDELLDCNIRDNYVKSVYSSMNKGSTGGFEF